MRNLTRSVTCAVFSAATLIGASGVAPGVEHVPANSEASTAKLYKQLNGTKRCSIGEQIVLNIGTMRAWVHWDVYNQSGPNTEKHMKKDTFLEMDVGSAGTLNTVYTGMTAGKWNVETWKNKKGEPRAALNGVSVSCK